jgi:hypothetical protein
MDLLQGTFLQAGILAGAAALMTTSALADGCTNLCGLKLTDTQITRG